MSQLETMREQLKQFAALPSEEEKLNYIENLKEYLVNLNPEEQSENLLALKTLAGELSAHVKSLTTRKQAA
ncbi:MAG: hypothetical protein LH606_08880 [Cytophagaceae bacterium]|nr:hypothetical protein [Cytophagaceae bacterium]